MALWEGKRYILLTAFILNLLSVACLFIAFVTPYWYISWPRVYSGFRRIGLWEVCFYGMLLPRDPSQKSYYGCWWILAPELHNIRDWVMPPWFIIVQILITVSLLIEIVNLVIVLIIWGRTGSYDKSGIGKRRVPFTLVQAATIITILTSVLKVISVIMFGLGAEFDIDWMPNHEINYPHVSYGLAILSAFFTIFASMGHRVFRGIIRHEYLQPSVAQEHTTGKRAPHEI
jgi:hypothetical protein